MKLDLITGLYLHSEADGLVAGPAESFTVADPPDNVAVDWDVLPFLVERLVHRLPMLDAAHHPTIRFRSSHFVYVAGRLATVGGALTLRGVTRPVELTVTRFVCRLATGDGGEICDAAAQASLHRSEFGMDSYALLIADEIRLDFVVVAHRAPAGDALR